MMQAQTKHEWRTWAKANRSPGDAAPFLERLTALPEWQAAYHILLYLALPGEINVEMLADVPAGKTFYAPRIAPRRALTVHAFQPGVTLLETNAKGLREPTSQTPQVAPERLDLVIVPGLLFDEWGNRLGYGGGHYDRFLARLRPDCVTVGVAVGNAVVPTLPTEAHDIAMQLIVTPTRTFRLTDTTEPIPRPCLS